MKDYLKISSAENSIEVIEINPDWFSEAATTNSSFAMISSTIVGQLPKDLFGSATLVDNEELTFFGGQQLNGASNYDIIVFNVATNVSSVLGSKLSTDIKFGEESYIVETGQWLFHALLQALHASNFVDLKSYSVLKSS